VIRKAASVSIAVLVHRDQLKDKHEIGRSDFPDLDAARQATSYRQVRAAL